MADHGPASIAPAPQLACRHPRNPRNHRFISNRNTTSFKIPANPMKINPKPNSNRNKNTTSPRRESPFTNLPRRQAGHHSQITNHDSQTAGSASRSASRDANQDSRITRFPTCRRQSQGHKRRSPSTNHQPASPAGGPPLTNHVIFNRQPARLEIVVSHTKQRPATQFNRQHFTTPGITIRAFCVPDAVGGWPTLLAQATDRLSVFWGGLRDRGARDVASGEACLALHKRKPFVPQGKRASALPEKTPGLREPRAPCRRKGRVRGRSPTSGD